MADAARTSTDSDRDETAPLLAGNSAGGLDENDIIGPPAGYCTVDPDLGPARTWKIYPVAFGVYIATAMVTTTTVEILRRLSCQFWYAINDPGSIPPGMIPADSPLCKIGAVEVLFSKVINAQVAFEYAGALISFALVGKYADKYGRRNLLLFICTLRPIATAAILLVFWLDNSRTLQSMMILIWYIFGALGHPKAISLLCSMYVVDTTSGPAERTYGLSMLMGATMAGLAPSFALGGLITTYTHNATTVFKISLSVLILTYLYIIFFLPESFIAKPPQLTTPNSETSGTSNSILKSIGSVFLPVKSVLTPRRDEKTGRLNFRLLTVAGVTLFGALGGGYIPMAFFIYSATHFEMKPDQTGIGISAAAFTRVFFTTLVFPRILALRPYYNRRFLKRGRASSGEEGEDERDNSSGSSQFDVVVAFISLLLDAIIVSMFGLAKNPLQFVILFMLQIIGSGNGPAIQSVAVASVDHSQSGIVLSGLQIIASIGELAAVIGMGAILSATVVKMPWVVFVVCGGTMSIAAMLLLLVRDSDRWKAD